MSDWVSFGDIKHSIGMETVLEDYGIRLKRVHTQYLRGHCPLPTHRSERSRESFGVHTGKNLWACHSASCCQARQGKVGGTVLDLVACMEGCTIREAALRLQTRWHGATGAEPVQQRVSKGNGPAASAGEPAPLRFSLPLRNGHAYLEQRGIERQTAQHFGVGYYDGAGFLRGRIVFPIHNARGELVAYAGRALNGGQPRYLFPRGFRKSQVVFNLHRARATAQPNHQVIAVEGFFDCLKVHQAGYRNVVALLGSSLSLQQWELLQAQFGEVILMLDGDEAGRLASRFVSQRWPSVCLAEVPWNRQPDELSAEEIHQILGGVPQRARGT